MKLDLKKEFDSNRTILLLVDSIDYNNTVAEVMKSIQESSTCYVTLNKTFPAIKDNLSKKGITTQNITFIDAISKTITDKPPQTKDCYYVSSPSALTEISITISKFLKHGFEYLIFDSLTNLLIYQKKTPIAKFVSTLVNKVRTSKTKAIFFALKINQHEELIQQASMFVDKVIDLSIKKTQD